MFEFYIRLYTSYLRAIFTSNLKSVSFFSIRFSLREKRKEERDNNNNTILIKEGREMEGKEGGGRGRGENRKRDVSGMRGNMAKG